MTQVTEILQLAMHALSAKALEFLSLGMCFGLFAWAMYLGGFLPLGVAIAFALLVFLPVLFKGSRKHETTTE